MAVHRPDPSLARLPLSCGAAGVLVVLGSAECNKSTKVKAGKRCGPFKGIKLLPELAKPSMA